MGDPRPFATLSSGLLARKGTARPAMRPQGFAQGEDLGWNDMGGEPVPVVLVEREALMQRIAPPLPVHIVSPAVAAGLHRETMHAGKAALTLRLDADRHLRLRLAGAITNRSAQDLMVQALDALIDAVPTVAALVAQLPTAPQRQHQGTSHAEA